LRTPIPGARGCPNYIRGVEQPDDQSARDGAAPPDVDELVAKLRVRVEERRREGAYPDGLEEDLAEHFRRILRQRAEPRLPPNLRGPLRSVEQALPLEPARIPVDSSVPGGQALHRAIARVVSRQTQGTLEQVQAFAQPVYEALGAIVSALEDLSRDVHVDLLR